MHPTWCYRRATFDLVGGYPEVLAEVRSSGFIYIIQPSVTTVDNLPPTSPLARAATLRVT